MMERHVNDVESMRALLEKCNLRSSDRYIVKPNWFFSGSGFYTDARTLELLLQCLDNVTVIESYTYQRNDGTRIITPENGRSCWGWIKEQDQKFLHISGFDVLLRDYDVEYVNLTEEVWSDNIANPENVRQAVEALYSPVMRKELYAQVPARIYALRGRKLISFAKLKQQRANRVSATLKNMFGNIIDPNRMGWHGKNDCDLATNIVDANKVYSSLFETVGLCEAIFTAVRYTKDGLFPLPWGFRYNLTKDLGLAFCGKLVDVDAYLSYVCGIDPNMSEHVHLAAKVFGEWSPMLADDARAHPIKFT